MDAEKKVLVKQLLYDYSKKFFIVGDFARNTISLIEKAS